MFDPALPRRAVLTGGLVVTAVAASGAPAGAQVLPAPSIAGTAEWGARSPSGPIEVLDRRPSKIIVHHTATDNSPDTSREHAFALAREIQALHMDGNGWIDTGQQFTNSRGGHLLEGRHRSLEVLRGGAQHVMGAHARTQNSVALGIENEGLYTGAEVPDALWTSLVQLCAFVCAQYGIEAGEIYGHRDFQTTECPGDQLYARLPELRTAVGTATRAAVAQPVVWPLLKAGAAGPVVSAVQVLLREQGAAVPVDGVFGRSTQDAATRFVAARGPAGPSCHGTRRAEPGLFGADAWEALVPVLEPGASGPRVRALQLLLTSRGLHSGEDRRFGARTAARVREFQDSRGLAVTGVVDRATWLRLVAAG